VELCEVLIDGIDVISYNYYY